MESKEKQYFYFSVCGNRECKMKFFANDIESLIKQELKHYLDPLNSIEERDNFGGFFKSHHHFSFFVEKRGKDYTHCFTTPKENGPVMLDIYNLDNGETETIPISV